LLARDAFEEEEVEQHSNSVHRGSTTQRSQPILDVAVCPTVQTHARSASAKALDVRIFAVSADGRLFEKKNPSIEPLETRQIIRSIKPKKKEKKVKTNNRCCRLLIG